MVSALSTIYVVDDDAKMRESLRWLLESANYKVETFDSAESFRGTYDSACGGCLILDISMPGMTGVELQDELSRKPNAPPIIYLTGHGNIPLAVRAIQKGAVAFLEKPFVAKDLLEKVEGALGKDREQRQSNAEHGEVQARISRLTRREREVLQLVVAAKSSKDIASELGVSYRTVENHRAKVLRKMSAHTTLDLVRMVLAKNIVGAPAQSE